MNEFSNFFRKRIQKKKYIYIYILSCNNFEHDTSKVSNKITGTNVVTPTN
jgi:hypothetical protein